MNVDKLRYCTHPSHPIPWQLAPCKHEKPRYRLVEGKWVKVG
jgi:hypothetical protein